MSETAPPGILKMTAPLVVSFWMRVAFSFVDLYYASFLGDASVAAVGLSFPFEFVMIAVWVGMSTGLTSNFSRAMGAREETKLQQYLKATWTLVLLCVPAFTLVGAACWVFARRLAPQGDVDVAREFAIYGATLLAGSAFTVFWSVIPDSVVKAHGDTKATMWAGIWSNVLNVVFNTIFTFVFHWGIFGIAFSTVLGRFGGLVYALRKAKGHEDRRKARAEPWVPGVDPHPYRAIFALAVPSALSYGLMASELQIVNWLLKEAPSGKEALAAYAIYYRIVQFALTPAIAASVAMLPFAARRFGAKDVAGVKGGLREAHLAGLGYVLLSAPILFFAAPVLSHRFTSSPVTISFLVPALRLIPIAALLAMPFFLCRPVFEGMGRGKPGLVLSTLRYAVLAGPAAWLGLAAAAAWGLSPIVGIVLGLAGANVVSSTVILEWSRRALGAAERASAAA